MGEENRDYYKPKCPNCGEVIGEFDNSRTAPPTQEQLDELVAKHLPNCPSDDMGGKSKSE